MSKFRRIDSFKMYIILTFTSQFLFTLIFTFNMLYQLKVVGLNPLQLVLVGTVLELTVFLFEIPTGLVADVKSRKLSIIIGYILIGTGFLIEGLFPFFIAVLVTQVLWGIGYTFTSGAVQAWIADEVGEEKASVAFVKGARVEKVGQLLAIPISMMIAVFTLRLPIIIGGLCFLVLALFLMFVMKETNFQKRESGTETNWYLMKENVKMIVVFSRRSIVIMLLLFIALFSGIYSEGLDRLWLAHLLEHPFFAFVKEEATVYVVGAIQFVVAVCSLLALSLLNRTTIYQQLNKIYRMLFVCTAIIVVSLIGFATTKYIIGLLFFYILIEVMRHLIYPLQDIWLNKMVPDSSTRATFFSVKGQADAIGQIGGGPFIGYVATGFSISAAFILSAFLLAPVLWLYKIVMKKSE
ncbi:MFS transporter [Bacillus sp. JJ722]|uniref:MFS transporter n=1 Tax=Bacillus sp. JJ722 TaxID=3122973 RepID=UPI003000E935